VNFRERVKYNEGLAEWIQVMASYPYLGIKMLKIIQTNKLTTINFF